MATDPGRALFKEQVQTHGFSFLDDYLNNILLNAKQDALIELVKTPGRKRTLTKRPKLASKLKEATTLFLEDEESHQNTIQDVAAPSHPSSQHHHSAEELSANTVQAKCLPAEAAHCDATVLEVPSSNPANPPRSSHSETKELSVIAEDDETAERSRASLLLPDATIASHEQDEEREPLRDLEPVPPSPKATSPLPRLAAPAPLHKSVRSGTENLIGPSVLGAATSGAPVTGKRTSWLQKARQANALEIAGKKTISSFSTASQLQPSSATLLTHNAKRKSTEAFNGPVEDDVERHHKAAKIAAVDTAPTNNNVNLATDSGSACPEPARLTSPLRSEEPHVETKQLEEEGMLDLLKKTVQGLGARAGKGKSLGGPAVTALAEARAAAEARIAERNMKEETMTVVCHPTSNERDGETFKSQPLASELSFSLDDRSSKSGRAEPLAPLTSEGSSQNLLPNTASDEVPAIDEVRNQGTVTATTTTPPCTPPLNRDIFIPPPGPVFNKPPPVFVAPSQVKEVALDQIEKPLTGNLPSSSRDSLTIKSTNLGVGFDKERSIPAWVLNAQDTVYAHSQNANDCDEDDSWPIDEKLAEGVQWIYEDTKDDNTTWSSLPSQQNTGNLSANVPKSGMGQSSENQYQAVMNEAGKNDLDTYNTGVDQEVQSVMSDSEPDDELQNATMSNSLKSQSQTSNSSSSQQSNVGFFGQATKLISNIMGSSKQAKPEVKKVLQKAAVAAKKQQEESDKKAARLKEMENRRQQAIQRKAEEEKARVVEQEKKIKEENERRKREREEHTDKRPLKVTNGRKEDDTAKKRKIEVDKKQDVKNSSINVPKSAVKLTIKQPSALSSSAAYNSSLNAGGSSAGGAKPDVGSMKPGAGSAKSKGKMPAKAPATEEELPQPSQIVQIQMAARAKAQLQAAKQANEPPSESIELPDINSEYSDSEDEDRQRTFDPPDWAQSPELREALQQQSTINPDDIFGAIRPLRMEEIFKTRTSRFRARTSSANWAGADRLTVEEEKEYARRMGFK